MTIKVKAWGEGQGDFVEIEDCDFDPAKHEKYDEKLASEEPKRKPRTSKANTDTAEL